MHIVYGRQKTVEKFLNPPTLLRVAFIKGNTLRQEVTYTTLERSLRKYIDQK